MTWRRSARAPGIGAIIGAIAGGGKGAAIGAVIGGGVGTGGVMTQRGKDIRLEPGQQLRIRTHRQQIRSRSEGSKVSRFKVKDADVFFD